MENESEACISHPVAVKFVDVKWRKRGFKYSLASITLSMIFHICLIIYTTLVVGEVKQIIVVKEADGKNVTRHIHKRESTSANAPNVMVLRIILLIITSGSVLKEIVQMKVQGIKYFTKVSRYYEISMRILVYLFLLPVEEEISTAHIASGSIAVLYSWITLIQYLKVVPVMGIYIIVVQKIFYTVMKISIVSTFVAMTSGFEYEEQFVNVGWHAEIYELKMAVLILCILVLSIVVNNALIGLAVGDTDEVMKSAKVDKFKRRANFIIHLEKSVNTIPYLRMKEDKFHIDFPQRKQNLYQKVVGLLYFGSEMDAVDGEKNEHEYEYEIIEMEITWEDHIEKAVELKLENFRSSLRDELKVIHDQIKEDRKHLEEKMEMISEKLK
ncbi:transient receptor potential cation channel subfamily A member 1-like [Paramuricea clavata]|uniref:Transient receptor potential cation channel subfamily A member 1-like n=1 Tax=Paramuricea clavata TaxID=317549 RepID=A0A7D9LA62_PARCT|nr:transient receptor potential cation channel subfamily A member 1-like [Paramuricea clavata]